MGAPGAIVTWAQFCGAKQEVREVDSITLEQAFGLLPQSLPVRFMKVDTQGMDFRLVNSASRATIRRAESFEIEVRATNCEPLYEG